MTLASEDGTPIGTHKVILASFSPFFMEILKRNKHPHPLIYMRGVKAVDLAAMVDFLYYGEANVNQESLDDFLGLAEELKLRGLTGSCDGTSSEKFWDRATATPEKYFEDMKHHIKTTPNTAKQSKCQNRFFYSCPGECRG